VSETKESFRLAGDDGEGKGRSRFFASLRMEDRRARAKAEAGSSLRSEWKTEGQGQKQKQVRLLRSEWKKEGQGPKQKQVRLLRSEWKSGGVVDDDLPAFVGFFEDEGEETVGVAALFFAAVEVVLADDVGEAIVERVDLEFGEGEIAHGGAGGVLVVVALGHAGVAAVDGAGEEEGVG